MSSCETPQGRTGILTAAGLAIDAATEWNGIVPDGTTEFSSDRHRYSDFWLKSARLIERLPDAARRNERERAYYMANREKLEVWETFKIERVGDGLVHVVGTQAPVKGNRVVEAAEGRVLGLGEARHGAIMDGHGRRRCRGHGRDLLPHAGLAGQGGHQDRSIHVAGQ